MALKKFLVCPDTFKEALPAREVASAIALGIQKVSPNAKITELPLADGGEGSLEAFRNLKDAEVIYLKTLDALGREIPSYYLIWKKDTALIELAQSAGLEKLSVVERNPLKTSTFGVGVQMEDAFKKGLKKFILFVGGSATNDGGAGLLEALGVEFFNPKDKKISPTGGKLEQICRISTEKLPVSWRDCQVSIACDVKNPLLGQRGASLVYAPQKGATADMAERLERNMRHWADLLKTYRPDFNAQLPGFGAAGGIASGLNFFLQADICSGFETIAGLIGLEKAIAASDVIFTGEGSVDGQTLEGKTPFGVAQIALKHRKPVVCLCGIRGKGYESLYAEGVTAVFSIVNGAMTLENALTQTPQLLTDTAENVVRLLHLKPKI